MNDETKQTVGNVVEMAVEAAEETVQRPGVKSLARFGFYTKGFLFIVIGILAILLLIGLDGGRLADATGALAAVAERPYGRVLLIVFILGAVAHGIWNVLRALADVDNVGGGWKGVTQRVFSIGVGIFYIGLALSALDIVLDAGMTGSSSKAEETFIAILLAIPILGAVLLTLIGLGVIAAGFSECYNGISGKFRENFRLWEISGLHLVLISILGVISFSARALLLIVMGYFFIRAAFDGDTRTSIGLDAALLQLLRSSYGWLLVAMTAIGLVGHGVLALYEARYRRIC